MWCLDWHLAVMQSLECLPSVPHGVMNQLFGASLLENASRGVRREWSLISVGMMPPSYCFPSIAYDAIADFRWCDAILGLFPLIAYNAIALV
jgi:hypothetical protein